MKTITRWSKVIMITVLLGSIALGVAFAASSATLKNYQIDFVEVTGEGQSRVWAYAITANGDEFADLSGWTLVIDSACGYKFKLPTAPSPPGATYTTPVSYILQKGPNAGTDICSGTYACQSTTYDVSQALDQTSHLRSITFNNPEQPLSPTNPVTHLFQITVDSALEHRIGDVGVTVDTGTGGSKSGLITGAVCPPTAVQLVNLTASSHPTSPALFLLFLVAGIILVLGLVVTVSRKLI